MSHGNWYVYAVMRTEALAAFDTDAAPFAAVDAPAAPLEILACGALSVLVSPVETDEVLSTRRNLLSHAKALECMTSFGSVAPMRFGLIAPSQAAVRAAVAAEADTLNGIIGNLENADEFVVRIAWNQEAAMREIVEAEPTLKRAYLSLQGKSEAATRDARIDLGRRVSTAIAAFKERMAERFLSDLAAFARDAVREEAEDDMMALKAAFLIERGAAASGFTAALDALEAETPGRLSVKLVGPGPAYSFSKAVLRWSAPSVLANAG